MAFECLRDTEVAKNQIESLGNSHTEDTGVGSNLLTSKPRKGKGVIFDHISSISEKVRCNGTEVAKNLIGSLGSSRVEDSGIGSNVLTSKPRKGKGVIFDPVLSNSEKVQCNDTDVARSRIESLGNSHIEDTGIRSNLQTSKPRKGKGVILDPVLSTSEKVQSNDACYRRSITDLPPALVSEILNCLDPKELGVVSCVSTALYSVAAEHNVWKEFYCKRWGFPLVPAFLGDKSWKELFVEREFRSKTFMGRYSIEVLYGHSEPVKTVFILASAKLIFTSGYDSIVRMWDMEEGLSIAASRPLGCTIRAVSADTKLLVCGGTDGFIHGWRAVEGLPGLGLFDLTGSIGPGQDTEFRLWEHEGPITCLALDFTKIYSGSWDMTVRIWDRTLLKCLKVLRHNDWVWALVPQDTSVASTSGSHVFVWDTDKGNLIAAVPNAHVGYTYALARSHSGDYLFTGGEDGAIHMFKCNETNLSKVATWVPHSGPVHSLAFEFPWLVSASSDGKLGLIDVRKLLKTSKKKKLVKGSDTDIDRVSIEPPQRMLHGYGCNLFSVDIGADRIVCGGEKGVVRIWNFTEALEIERKAHALRGIRLENRMRRRKLQVEMNSKGGRGGDQCSVAAVKKNQVNKRGVSSKLKA